MTHKIIFFQEKICGKGIMGRVRMVFMCFYNTFESYSPFSVFNKFFFEWPTILPLHPIQPKFKNPQPTNIKTLPPAFLFFNTDSSSWAVFYNLLLPPQTPTNLYWAKNLSREEMRTQQNNFLSAKNMRKI